MRETVVFNIWYDVLDYLIKYDAVIYRYLNSGKNYKKEKYIYDVDYIDEKDDYLTVSLENVYAHLILPLFENGFLIHESSNNDEGVIYDIYELDKNKVRAYKLKTLLNF